MMNRSPAARVVAALDAPEAPCAIPHNDAKWR